MPPSAGTDRTPRTLVWAPNNRGIYFNIRADGYANVFYAPLDGDVRQVTTGKHLFGMNDMSRRGTAVGMREDAHEPGDIVAFDVENADEVTRLTRVNADILTGKTLGDVEEVWYKSFDELDIHGWIIKPPDFDASRKYPLMLAIHGGPHGMYDGGFNFGWQNHAANGYVVLYTNPRGSSGYGSEFGNAIQYAYQRR